LTSLAGVQDNESLLPGGGAMSGWRGAPDQAGGYVGRRLRSRGSWRFAD